MQPWKQAPIFSPHFTLTMFIVRIGIYPSLHDNELLPPREVFDGFGQLDTPEWLRGSSNEDGIARDVCDRQFLPLGSSGTATLPRWHSSALRPNANLKSGLNSTESMPDSVAVG